MMRLIILLLFVCVRTELQLKPHASLLKKNVGESLVLTCEWEEDVMMDSGDDDDDTGGGDSDTGGADDDGVIRWYDVSGKEVVSRNSSTTKFVENDNGHTQKLFLNEIERDDAGWYKCTRQAGAGVQSKSIQLIVLQDISFGSTAPLQHPLQGADVIINCSASSHPPAVVSWIFKKKKIGTNRNSQKYKQTEGGLMIRNVSIGDSGVYLCRAEVAEEAMFDEMKISVDVYEPPRISLGMQEVVEEMEGEEVVISCEAEGNPSPSFQFFKDDEAIPSDDRFKADQTSLTIASVEEGDAGVWECRAVNLVGKDASKGKLVVLVKPSVSSFSNISITESQPSHLECILRGNPPADVSFQRISDGAVFKDGDYEDGDITVYTNGVNVRRLTIKSTTPHHAGAYVCRGVSDLGECQATAVLTVLYKPKFLPEQQTSTHIWAGKQRNISCEVHAVPPPEIKWTRLGESIEEEGGYKVFNVAEGKSELQLTATPSNLNHLLTPVTCHASNQYGSSTARVQVKLASVPSSLASINVTEAYSTGFLLLISPPQTDGGEPLLDYVVEAVEDGDEFNVSIAEDLTPHQPAYHSNQATLLQINETHLRVLNLQPDVTYILKVRARNEVGLGDPVSITASTISIRKPYPVTVVTQALESYHVFLLKWEELRTGGRDVSQLEFRYRKAPDNDTEENDEWVHRTHYLDLNTKIDHVEVYGLDSNTTYQVQAQAKNEIGWSGFGPITEFRTRIATPQEQRLMQKKAHSHVGIIIILVFIIIILLILLIFIDLICYRFCGCGVSKALMMKMRGENAKSSEKERVVEEGEKECLKQDDDVIKPTIVYETIDENGQKVDLSKEQVA